MSKAIDMALVEEAGSFYVSERKVYPRDVTGRFARLRKLIFALRADTPFRAAGFSGKVTADVRITLRRDRVLERNLRLTGGILVSPGGGGGSSVAP